jgi:tetratricopeptide (TPR) repeat protein
VAPADPDVWYRCGVLEMEDGDTAQACRSWRHCLELSDQHLADVLDRVGGILDPAAILQEVLPDRPELILAAADRLYPPPEAAERRRPFQERALALLERPPVPLAAADLQVRADLHAALGRPEEALTDYRMALAREPQRADWRYQYARLLYHQGRLRDARREALLVLAQQPENAPARQLFRTVTGALLEKGVNPE